MLAHLRAILALSGLTLATCAVAYPLAILAIGQGLYTTGANGSLVTDSDDTVIGSRLIAQGARSERWFRPRPSAVGHNAAGSGGSNWGANNPKLRERAVAELEEFPDGEVVPADAVTASGSGLDPHVTLRNARLQVPRVAAGWAQHGLDPAAVREVIDCVLTGAAFLPLNGLAGGEPLVNVVEVNLALRQRLTLP